MDLSVRRYAMILLPRPQPGSWFSIYGLPCGCPFSRGTPSFRASAHVAGITPARDKRIAESTCSCEVQSDARNPFVSVNVSIQLRLRRADAHMPCSSPRRYHERWLRGSYAGPCLSYSGRPNPRLPQLAAVAQGRAWRLALREVRSAQRHSPRQCVALTVLYVGIVFSASAGALLAPHPRRPTYLRATEPEVRGQRRHVKLSQAQEMSVNLL